MLLPRAREPGDNLLIFKQDFSGDGKRDTPIQQGPKYWVKWLAAAKDLQKDASVQTDGHA